MGENEAIGKGKTPGALPPFTSTVARSKRSEGLLELTKVGRKLRRKAAAAEQGRLLLKKGVLSLRAQMRKQRSPRAREGQPYRASY